MWLLAAPLAGGDVCVGELNHETGEQIAPAKPGRVTPKQIARLMMYLWISGFLAGDNEDDSLKYSLTVPPEFEQAVMDVLGK